MHWLLIYIQSFLFQKVIDAHIEKVVSGLFKKFSSSKLPLSLQPSSSASEIQQMEELQGRKLSGDASTSSAPSQKRMYTQSEAGAILVMTDILHTLF